MSHEHRHNPERYYDDEGEVLGAEGEPLHRCLACEGVGYVAMNFGLWSPGRPAIVNCPKCNGSGFRQ